MTLRLTDLHADEIQLMIRLDDGLPHEDSVGINVDDLRPQDVGPMKRLMGHGLAEEIVGWHSTTPIG